MEKELKENMEVELIKKELDKARAELSMLYEIGKAMHSTLNLDEILYIILTAVTAHTGLGFNRAMLFMVNEKENLLEGRMGIGPQSGEEAYQIWKKIETEKMDLNDFIEAYKEFSTQGGPPLNHQVKTIKIPLREDGGILALSVMEGMPFLINTPEARTKINDIALSILKVDQFVVVPLKAKEKSIGVILADNFVTKKTITNEDMRLLIMFANQAGLAIDNSRLYEQTLLLSNTDYLTRLWNHGYFQQLISEEIKKALENKTSLGLIMLDIDNFKNYNDTLGHQAGDKVLQQLGTIIRENIRRNDWACRYGGEEFAIILPQTNKEDTYKFAERLRIKLEQHPFPKEEIQPQQKITVSLGVANFPEDATHKDELIYKADMAMLEAKKRGRNRTCQYTSQLLPRQ
ncbi:MAG: sensor domain-containing diguanylate cyclase [Candidatus Omnitrophica bacterium]|nr:sensor domain-containing diguanylate cyclase [Candidatus Omnitrophota bacterium]MCM8797849.1 sensor domain-containing diguanylate cyclase [Candidatus Omnitrophota bacterium]